MSLKQVVSLHFFNNLLAFLPQIDINAPVDSSPITSSDATTSIISGLILFLIGMYFFIKFILKNKNQTRTPYTKQEEFLHG